MLALALSCLWVNLLQILTPESQVGYKMGSAAQAGHVSVCEFVAAGDFLRIIYREANNNLYCEADRLLRIITATDLCHNVLLIL